MSAVFLRILTVDGCGDLAVYVVYKCVHSFLSFNVLSINRMSCDILIDLSYTVVDRIDGSVVSRDAVDTAELLEDGVLRYFGWEFAEDDAIDTAAYYIKMLEDCMIPENRGMMYAKWADSITCELEQEVFDEYFADESQDTKNWFVVYHNEKKG